MNHIHKLMAMLPTIGLLLLAIACDKPESTQESPTITQSTETVTPEANPSNDDTVKQVGTLAGQPVNMTLGPVSVFETTCKRCHGLYGSLYPPKFYELKPPEIAEYVHEMMNGPAQLTPTQVEETAMTAHHISLQKKVPFAIVTNAKDFLDNGGALKGEVTGEGEIKLVVIKDGKESPLEIQKGKWALSDPPESPFEIRVSNSNTFATFEFPSQLWTLPKEK